MSEEEQNNLASPGNPREQDSLGSSSEEAVVMGGMILTSGSVFGQYRVLSLLGRGGMGEVYEVEHCVLRRKYALKMLLADFVSSPDALERFKSEARVMSNLEHPNIIRVDEFGEEGGRAWLRMELAAGLDIQGTTVRSLAQYVKAQGGRLSLAEARTIFTDILQGLAYSHSQEIVHRDLKPANILICPGTNSKVNFKIADFGLVRMLGEEWVRTRAEQSFREAGSLSVLSTVRTNSSTGTSTHSLIGTYEYMSPEQKRCEDADKQSDVYAVGLMLYRLLTGRELVPRPPSHFAQELSSDWDDFILKALEEKPEKRFADAAAMLKAFPSGLECSTVPLRLKTLNEPVPSVPETISVTDSSVTPAPLPEEPDILPPPLPDSHRRFRMPGILSVVLILGVVFFWRWQSGKAEQGHSPETSLESAQEEVGKGVDTGLPEKGIAEGASAATVENVSTEPKSEPELAVRVPFGFQASQNVLEPYLDSGWAKEAIHSASGIVMVYIPSGSFTMGSPVQEQADAINGGSKAEWVQIEKQHSVTLKYGFYMGACEITQEQWEKVMAENPAEFKNAGRNAPVERVSWEDCQRFCRRLGEGFRLPTEAEWEYACRAGTQSAVYSGKLTCAGVYNSPELDEIAWYGGNSKAEYEGAFDSSSWNEKQIDHQRAGTQPVGLKKPNAWGLYDMLGNVMEWCQDCYGDYNYSAGKNPVGPRTGTYRVIRGGGWSSQAMNCRAARRSGEKPGYRSSSVGFRVVRTLP